MNLDKVYQERADSSGGIILVISIYQPHMPVVNCSTYMAPLEPVTREMVRYHIENAAHMVTNLLFESRYKVSDKDRKRHPPA